MKTPLLSGLAVAAVASALMIGPVQAQGPGGPGGGGGGMGGGGGGGMMGRPPGGGPGGDPGSLETLLKTLNLTNAQKAKVQPIVDATTPQIQAIREEARTKTEAAMQSAEAQIKPLLTPYQQQVLASTIKNREAMRKGPPSGGGRPAF